MSRNKKSQMAVTDLFIALFVAMILIVIILFVWNRYTVILQENKYYDGLQVVGFQTTDLLVKSRGEPENWEETPDNVDTIGLAYSDRNISTEKLNAFLSLSYANASQALGLRGYNFRFRLKNINGTILEEYGKNPGDFVVDVQRVVIYQNEKSIVELAIW